MKTKKDLKMKEEEKLKKLKTSDVDDEKAKTVAYSHLPEDKKSKK